MVAFPYANQGGVKADCSGPDYTSSSLGPSPGFELILNPSNFMLDSAASESPRKSVLCLRLK